MYTSPEMDVTQTDFFLLGNRNTEKIMWGLGVDKNPLPFLRALLPRSQILITMFFLNVVVGALCKDVNNHAIRG